MKTIAIYALIYSNNLHLLVNIVESVFDNMTCRKIEQGSVLLFDNEILSLSLEPSNENYYISGEYNGILENIEKKLIEFGNQYHDLLSKQYNISYKET